jgi:hypothetical protein
MPVHCLSDKEAQEEGEKLQPNALQECNHPSLAQNQQNAWVAAQTFFVPLNSPERRVHLQILPRLFHLPL